MKKVLALVLCLMLCLPLASCISTDYEKPKVTDNENDSDGNKEKDDGPSKEEIAQVGQTVTLKNWEISLLSAKIYDQIGEDYYVSKPDEGKKFLVVMLEAKNISEKDEYFNYFYVSGYVDEYNQDMEILLNDVDGVPVIAGDVAVGKKIKGYLAWQVPENWKTLEFDYNDNLFSTGSKAKFIVTPDKIS